MNQRIMAGYRMAKRASASRYRLMMPRDENEARGIALFFGVSAADVTRNLTALGVSAATLIAISRRRAA